MKKSKSDRMFSALTKNGKLPIIRIKKYSDSPGIKVILDTEDKVYKAIIQIGKEVATEKDYFGIGFRHMIEDTIKYEKEQKKKKRK